MKLEQYIHNKGQMSIVQDELIKELNGKIKILEDEIVLKDKLLSNSEEIIKQQDGIIKLSETINNTLKKLLEKEKNLRPKSIWSHK